MLWTFSQVHNRKFANAKESLGGIVCAKLHLRDGEWRKRPLLDVSVSTWENGFNISVWTKEMNLGSDLNISSDCHGENNLLINACSKYTQSILCSKLVFLSPTRRDIHLIFVHIQNLQLTWTMFCINTTFHARTDGMARLILSPIAISWVSQKNQTINLITSPP